MRCNEGVRKTDERYTGGPSDDSEEAEEDESSWLSELESLDDGSAELELEIL